MDVGNGCSRLTKQGKGGGISPTAVAEAVQSSPAVLPGFTARTPSHFAIATYYLFTGECEDGAFLVHEGSSLESLKARFPSYSAWPAHPQPREQVLWHLVPIWKSFAHSTKVEPHMVSEPAICEASLINEWSGCVSGYLVQDHTLVVRPIAYRYGQDSACTMLLPLQLRSVECGLAPFIQGFKTSLGLQHGRGKDKSKRSRSFTNVSPSMLLSAVHSGAAAVASVRGDNLLVSTGWPALCDPLINQGQWFDGTQYTLETGHELAVNIKKGRVRVQTDHEVLQRDAEDDNDDLPEQPLMDAYVSHLN
jgi:hypothetical protein